MTGAHQCAPPTTPSPQYPEDQDVEVVAHTAAVNSAYAAAHGYSFLLDKPEPKPGKARRRRPSAPTPLLLPTHPSPHPLLLA